MAEEPRPSLAATPEAPPARSADAELRRVQRADQPSEQAGVGGLLVAVGGLGTPVRRVVTVVGGSTGTEDLLGAPGAVAALLDGSCRVPARAGERGGGQLVG